MKIVTKACRFAAMLAALVLPLAGGAVAQDYPTKPIKLVLPYAPGGATDFIGRTLAQYMSTTIGQQVIAENRTGSGGIPGTDYVVRSAPDGYTIVMMDPALVINPTLLPSVPFDFAKDLQVVSRVNSSPLVLVVSPTLPVKTYAEFLAYAKAHPGKLNFASAGIGTTPHLASELWRQRAGVDAVHVPYRGIGQSYTDMMAGKIAFAFSSPAGALPFTKDNRVIPLAVSSLERSEVYPDVPTVDSLGMKGFEVDLWYEVLAPAAVPRPIIDKLNATMVKVLAMPEMKEAFGKIGAVPVSSTPKDGTAFLTSEYEKWKKVMVDGNIKEQ